MNTGLIVDTRAGKEIPEAYRNRITENFKTTLGYSTVENGSIEFQNFRCDPAVFKNESFPMDETIQTLIKDRGDGRIVWHFGNHPEGVHENDAQPFPVIMDNNKILVTAALEGEFLPHSEEGSKLSNEYHMNRNCLSEKVKKAYKESGSDLKKLKDTLESVPFRKDMQAHMYPRGVITLMLANEAALDQVVILSFKNERQMEYTWGWVSQAMGYIETPEASAEEPVMTLQEKIEAKRKAKLAERETAAAPPPAEKTIVKATDNSGRQIPAIINDPDKIIPLIRNGVEVVVQGAQKYFFPDGKMHGKALIGYYAKHLGWKPDNVDDRPGIPSSLLMPDSGYRHSLKRLADLGNAAASAVTSLVTHETKEPVVITGFVPVVQPEQAKQFIKAFNEADLADPNSLKEQMVKYEPFSKQLALENGVAGLLYVPPKMWVKTCKENPHLATCAILELAAALLDAKPSLLQAAVKKEEKELTLQEKIEAKRQASLAKKSA